MIDCKITENYLKEKARMTRFNENGYCKIGCDNCPLSPDNNGRGKKCVNFEKMFPAEAIAIVQKWSDEHPQKTYKDDFFEKFPNAQKDERGAPRTCRANVYGTGTVGYCGYDCRACWNKVMEVTE